MDRFPQKVIKVSLILTTLTTVLLYLKFKEETFTLLCVSLLNTIFSGLIWKYTINRTKIGFNYRRVAVFNFLKIIILFSVVIYLSFKYPNHFITGLIGSGGLLILPISVLLVGYHETKLQKG